MNRNRLLALAGLLAVGGAGVYLHGSGKLPVLKRAAPAQSAEKSAEQAAALAAAASR